VGRTGLEQVLLRRSQAARDYARRHIGRSWLACPALERTHKVFLGHEFGTSGTSSALHRSKTSERIAAAGQRDAVVKQFRARIILVDMCAELAGILISSLVIFLGQSNAMYYPFWPCRKHPELLDRGNY
jgi:hypothetical protein